MSDDSASKPVRDVERNQEFPKTSKNNSNIVSTNRKYKSCIATPAPSRITFPKVLSKSRSKTLFGFKTINSAQIESDLGLESHLLYSELLQRTVLDTILEKEIENSTSKVEDELILLQNKKEDLEATIGDFDEISTLCKEIEKIDNLAENLQNYVNVAEGQVSECLHQNIKLAVDKLGTKNISVDNIDLASACEDFRNSFKKLQLPQASNRCIEQCEVYMRKVNEIAEDCSENLDALDFNILNEVSHQMDNW